MSDFLARFGIGNATVDLRLPRDVEQGATVDASIHVEGGDTEQDIESIYAALRSELRDDDTRRSYTIQQYELVGEGFTIGPGATREFDVELTIPRHTPVTTLQSRGHGVPVWIDTGLDVDWAVDPDDRDTLNVHPGGEFAALHEALTEQLGFRPHSSEIEQRAGWANYGLEVDYRPEPGSQYADTLDELEVLFSESTTDGLPVRFEVDERGVGLFDESYKTTTITSQDPEEAAAIVQNVIGE